MFHPSPLVLDVCFFFLRAGEGLSIMVMARLFVAWLDHVCKVWVEVGQQIWEGVSRSPFCATKDLRSSNPPVVQNTFA
jgi:hypothetical protein